MQQVCAQACAAVSCCSNCVWHAGHPSTCPRLLRKLDDRNKISHRGPMHSCVPYHATGIANVELVNVTQHKLQLPGNGSEVEPAPPADAPFIPW